jgi:hypothetical protein
MYHMDTIQNYIEITRQQIIRQLQEEIAHFQGELYKLSAGCDRECDVMGYRLYSSIIRRKRQLISSLS